LAFAQEATMGLSDWLFIGSTITGVLAVLLIASTIGRTRGNLLRWCGALLLLALALPMGGLGLLLRHYNWLTTDQPVAIIALKQLAPQDFQATLVPTGKQAIVRELFGDQWQLDARIVRWQLPAAFAGLPAVYRLERLSGRYAEPQDELAKPRSVHDLREGWDFWTFQQRYFMRLRLVDARWGSAAYLPMLDGATYRVSINPRGGLVATPADTKTEGLLRAAGW
jgi:hypothetical protein